MLIFDRWGELIFESDDINKGWNGQVKDFNKKAQIDVYVCLINVTDILNIAHRSVSHVSLIR